MHYYKRNIGNYYKRAGRLTMLQHGSFTLLHDSCYDREQFPTLEEAIDWCWASSKEEIEAIEFVLKKFFVKQEDGTYVNEEIKADLDDYRKRKQTNKKVAIEREAKKKQTKPKEKVTKSARVVHESSPKENESPPNYKLLTNNQELLTNKNENDMSETSSDPPCPYEKLRDLYNEVFKDYPMVQKCVKVTDKRKPNIKRRWKAYGSSFKFWEDYFTCCTTSDFLMGKVEPREGFTRFEFTFDKAFDEKYIVGIQEGKYHGVRRTSNTGHQPAGAIRSISV